METDRIFAIQGDIVASQVMELVTRSKRYLEETGSAAVKLDLGGVTSIDSTGISFLIGIYKSAAAQRRKMQIIGVKPEIRKLFELMKLDELFEIAAPDASA